MAFVPTQIPTPFLPMATADAGAPSGLLAAPVPSAMDPEQAPTGDPRNAFVALLASITTPAPAAPAAVAAGTLGQGAQAPRTEASSPGVVPADPSAAAEAILQPAGKPSALPVDQPLSPADDSVTPPLPAPPSPVEATVATDEQQMQIERTARTVEAAPLAQIPEAAPPAEQTGEAHKVQAPERAQTEQMEQAPAPRAFAAATDADPVASTPASGVETSMSERADDRLSTSDAGKETSPAEAGDLLQASRKATADKVAADIILTQTRPLAQGDAPQTPRILPARSDAGAERGPLETALASAGRMGRAPTAGGDAGLGTADRQASPQAAVQAPQAAPQAPAGGFAALLDTMPRSADQPDPSASRIPAASDTATSGDPLSGLKSLSLASGTAAQTPQPASAAAQAPAPATHLPPNTPAVPVSLGIAKAVASGQSRITVRLDPPELGRVEVRLDFAGDGTVKALVRADNHHTLDLLQRDSRLLERALSDSGLKADSGSLSFSLNQGGQDAAFAGNPHGGRGDRDAPFGTASSDPVETPDPDPLEHEFTGTAQGGVNLVI